MAPPAPHPAADHRLLFTHRVGGRPVYRPVKLLALSGLNLARVEHVDGTRQLVLLPDLSPPSPPAPGSGRLRLAWSAPA